MKSHEKASSPNIVNINVHHNWRTLATRMPSVVTRVQCDGWQTVKLLLVLVETRQWCRARPLLWPEPVRRASASASVTWTSAAEGHRHQLVWLLTQHGIIHTVTYTSYLLSHWGYL